MNIAVTGGAGFLGIPLVRKLCCEGHCVTLLRERDDKGGKPESLPVRNVQGDINDQAAVHELLNGVELVFHLAGKVHDPRGNPEDFYRINIEGTENLIKAVIRNKTRKIVFYSTIMVYGKMVNNHDDENSFCSPRDAYGVSKLKAEQIVLGAAKACHFDAVVMRLPVVYGPYDKGNVRRLITAVARRQFFYFGNGLAKRSMVYSGNVTEAAYLAATEACGSGGSVYCVSDGEDYSIVELVEAICEGLGTDWRPKHMPLFFSRFAGRCGDVMKPLLGKRVPIDSDQVKKLSSSLTFSCEKIQKELGYRPVAGLKEGIKAEIDWMRDEGLL